MKTPITVRLASFAAALVITFTSVYSVASYALPQPADRVIATACHCR